MCDAVSASHGPSDSTGAVLDPSSGPAAADASRTGGWAYLYHTRDPLSGNLAVTSSKRPSLLLRMPSSCAGAVESNRLTASVEFPDAEPPAVVWLPNLAEVLPKLEAKTLSSGRTGLFVSLCRCVSVSLCRCVVVSLCRWGTRGSRQPFLLRWLSAVTICCLLVPAARIKAVGDSGGGFGLAAYRASVLQSLRLRVILPTNKLCCAVSVAVFG